MASAAGIIAIAGGVTIAHTIISGSPFVGKPVSFGSLGTIKGPANVWALVPWRVIPATAVAAALFAGLSTLNEKVAKALAAVYLIHVALFAGPSLISGAQQLDGSFPSDLGTVLGFQPLP